MCAPKVPKTPMTPVRQTAKLPDNGDPTIAVAARTARAVTPASMILANANGTLGKPLTTNPLGR